ncbi:hypothetical protein BKA62DRAFT_769627 [Auriculariales sp. MPI-PUGE-AT-0066]|nr:hypothetical protein BKA62DRAFT_769627 [Auriculariales sp. MPI-PUGE-AT-0066]
MSHSQYRVSPIGSDGFEYPSHFPEQHDSSVDGLEDEDEDIEDDTDIWTPVDERFNRDYLPEHHMRNDDLPSLGDEQHQNNFGDHGEIIHHHRKHSKLGLQVQTLTSTIQPALINAHLSETDVSTSGSFSQNDWHPPNDARISIAAEALFQHLKTTPAHHPAPLSSSSAADTVTCDIGSAISSFPQPPFESTASPVTSTDSVARNVNPGSNRSWKSTITPAAFRSLVSRHGNVEMHRQEAIWNLCESEQAFLQDIRLILQTFVQPLRTQDKKWLPGVPTDVARLFDWLDDIIQLHTHLHSALYAARSNQYPVVLHVAETLRPFVSRLELYQPYLGKLEQVITVIKNSLLDTGSDFGEFVRMQMAHVSELRGASLVDLLQLPAERVSAYPRLFHELWQLSPRSHPDHLATLSLTHSTAIVVQALLEVCSREEEHDRIKELSARITGLPRHFNLAKRGRRLVAQGLIQRIQLMDAELAALERFEPSAVDGNVSPCMPILSPRYLTADHAREPSASLGSSSWLHAENTLKAALTRSRSASNSDKSTGKPQHDDISFRRDTPSPVLTRQRHGVVYAWVFTDLVLFASLTQTTSAKEECWTLVEDIGLSRVTAVNDLSGGLGYDNLIALDLLPMAQERGGVNVAPLHSSPFAVFFTPYRSTSQRISGRVLDESARIWLQAFEKCFLFTLRSLSFPCLGDHLAHGPDADLEMDTKASVVSILSVGLPLPKSPSQLIIDNETGRLPDTIEDERAERGWWAVRFRQVLRDLQRQDIAPTASSRCLNVF